MSSLPRPRWTGAEIAVAPPGNGPGTWVGAPSAICQGEEIFLAYRVRRPIAEGRGVANVIARSTDGVHFTTVAEVGKDRFGGASLERPALVVPPSGSWRLYLSVATPGTKHWRVVLLEADSPAGLGDALDRTVLPGDETVGVKDPVLLQAGGRWHLWASCHPLERDEDADRMSTWHATSPDGIDWEWRGVALSPRPGFWDARGARVTAVVPTPDGIVATYDGRATAAENYEERTGVAVGTLDRLTAGDGEPIGSPNPPHGLRYLTVVTMPDGRQRIYYEATRTDGAHELRTEVF